MIESALPNAAAHKLTISNTAVSLLSAIQTAASDATYSLPDDADCVEIDVESGSDLRILTDGNTPTATNGNLIAIGEKVYMEGTSLKDIKMIRSGGSDVVCNIRIGRASEIAKSTSSRTNQSGVLTDLDALVAALQTDGDAYSAGGVAIAGGAVADPTSLATVTAANVGKFLFDLKSRAIITLGTLLAGEDLTNDRMKTEFRGTYAAVATADAQIKASAGFVYGLIISCNDSAPTAGSIILYDNTAESGTQVFNMAVTTTYFTPFFIPVNASFGTGIYLGFTTTADVNVTVIYR